MNVLNVQNSSPELIKSKNNSLMYKTKKKSKVNEFKQLFNKALSEKDEDWEEFRVLLPKHGRFWDNGYEDLE